MALNRAHMLRAGWITSISAAIGVRAWNAIFGPLFYGYDAWAHIAYVFFIDLYHALPYADQGWSYFHPPLHYLLGWIVMQFGDPRVLLIGLACIGSAASLGVAALGAYVVRMAFPARDGLALLGFTALAFLPVHLYTSPMPGNEMTAAFFGAAAIAAHLRSDARQSLGTERGIRDDALTGLLCGLALLSKVTALIPCLAIFAWTTLHWLRAGDLSANIPQLARRAVVIVVPLLLVAGPWYGRNFVEFGSPILTSEATTDVMRVQSEQFPGERGVLDFVQISPKLFKNSMHDAPHMVHSVWASTYLNIWFDTYREGQLPLPKPPTWNDLVHRLTIFFGVLGLLPTWIALLGAGVAMRRVLRDRDAVIPLAMLVLSAGSIAAFILFTIRIPTWAALKASYLLNLSLPFAYFLALGAATLAKRGRAAAVLPGAAIGVLALAAAVTFTSGLGIRMHDHSNQHASVDAHFGHFQATRDHFRANQPNRSYLEARAAVEILDGDPDLSRRFYKHAARIPAGDPSEAPYYANRLAVASALARDFEAAQQLLNETLLEHAIPELLVNRGALHLFRGDVSHGLADLRAAVEADSSIPPAWRNLSVGLWLSGDRDAAADALQRAKEEEEKPPRGFPYGVGTGYIVGAGAGQRFMLELALSERLEPNDELELRVYRPARARNHSQRETRLHEMIPAPASAAPSD